MSGIGCPCVTTKVRLLPIISIPSVTMNEGILAFVTMKPTNRPSRGPTKSGAISPSAITHQG